MVGIENKVIVITGASSGLGAEAARHLAQAGAKLVLGARRRERLEALAAELGLGNGALMVVDVAERDQVKALVDHAVQHHGRVDVLVNNAGLMQQSPLESLQIDEWDAMIDINVKGMLYGIAAALPHMKSQQSGHIINISSVAGHTINPGGSVYSATKHAVRALSEGFRQEVKPYDIRTTIVSPGAIATELPNHITHPQMAERMQAFYDDYAIAADSFARAIVYAISQPDDVDINEILFRPTRQKR